MSSRNLSLIIIATQLVLTTIAADLILRPNIPVCSTLISSFDPIKVEAKFPAIGSKAQGQHFIVTLTNFKTSQIEHAQQIQDNRVYRQNFYLQKNILYELCFEFISHRQMGKNEVVFVSFLAEEHFDTDKQITIPAQLVGEENIEVLYKIGSKMSEYISSTTDRQKKERQIEDRLVDLSSHKTKRIVTITVIECGVIILSGIYQIFALRRFLIDKNLY